MKINKYLCIECPLWIWVSIFIICMGAGGRQWALVDAGGCWWALVDGSGHLWMVVGAHGW